MLFVYLLLTGIFLPMFIRAWIENYQIHVYFAWMEFLALICGLIFWGLRYLNYPNRLKHGKFDKFYILYIFIIVLIFFVSIEQLTKGIKWDSANYYKFIVRLNEITFSPNDIVLLKNCGHSCYAYSLFVSIGENILPFHGLGVRIENIVIWIICCFLVDKILLNIMPYIKKAIRLIVLLLFALTPAILGTIQDISPEIYLVLFFTAFLYSYQKKRWILQLFWGTALVFTKETGILLIAAFYVGWFIVKLVLAVKSKCISQIINKENIFFSLIIYIPAFVFLVYFIVDTAWGTTSIAANDNLTEDYLLTGNTFGVNMLVIVTKLKQMFVLNFNWLPTLICLIGFLYLIIRRKKKKVSLPIEFIVPFVFSYLAFLLMQLFYITYTFPRYIMLQYVFGMIVFAYFASVLPFNNIFRSIYILNIILLCIQNYYCIDLISLKVFSSFNTGNGTMLVDSPLYINSAGKVVSGNDANILQLSPYAQYNKQWSYFDVLIDKILQRIDYSSEDILWLPDCFWPYSTGIYWGYWQDNYYDKEINRVTQIFDSNNKEFSGQTYINYSLISEKKQLVLQENYNTYYLSFSFSNEIDSFVLKNYNCIKFDVIEYRGWVATIYQIYPD